MKIYNNKEIKEVRKQKLGAKRLKKKQSWTNM